MHHLHLALFFSFISLTVTAQQAPGKAEPDEQLRDYERAISKADSLYNGKNWQQAKIEYEKAHAIKPGEEKPVIRLRDIIFIHEPNSQKEKEYNEALKQGKAAFSMEDYRTARTCFKEALAIKPGDQYLKDKLKECENLLQQQQEK